MHSESTVRKVSEESRRDGGRPFTLFSHGEVEQHGSYRNAQRILQAEVHPKRVKDIRKSNLIRFCLAWVS